MNGTILIVDDYSGIVNLMRAALAQRGFRVETAARGMDGVRMARELKPDLIIMDISLPDMDGLMAAYMIRASAAGRSTPILAMSARPEWEIRAEVESVGCVELIQKPFVLYTLLERVEQTLTATRVLAAVPA